MVKNKTVIENFTETVGEFVKTAVMPTAENDPNLTATDAAAMPITYTSPKARQLPEENPTVKKSKNKRAKKTAKKSTVKKKTARKVAKKKKAKR